jgi:kumamolisin
MTDLKPHSYLHHRTPAWHRYHGKAARPGKNQCYFKVRAAAVGPRDAAGSGAWMLPDLCKAYNWPTGLAGGGVIAIVELGGGWVQSDINAFFSSIDQPVPSIIDVSVDGSQNNPNQSVGQEDDPDYEVALDIEVAGCAYYAATGKPATIRMYWASGSSPQGIANAVRKAAQDGCDVCSISWGSDEANWKSWGQQAGIDLIADMEAAATVATGAGMIVFAAAGDNDSSDGGQTPANVDCPSSCPHVVGCGGTNKTATSETVWNDTPGNTNGEGTGGGYSTYFPTQAFQIGAPPPPVQNPPLGRMIPDVSADADPNTGYTIVVHGQTVVEGGTSAVAPLYAGLFAAFGTKLGFVTPKLWDNQSCFNDITQGSNGFYDAGPGPDPCSGIGTPIGTALAGLLVPVGTPATAV